MKKIADFYLKTLIINAKFGSSLPIADQQLLFRDFLAKLNTCILQYKALYPNQDVTFTETYRSNVLQPTVSLSSTASATTKAM